MSEAEASALSGLFAALSRRPDLEAPELLAHDATDALLLETAAAGIRGSDGDLVVIGDRHGALTLGAVGVLGANRVRTHQDPLLGERALAANAERIGIPSGSFASHGLDAGLLEGARVVLMQLPRGLEALDETAAAIARWARPDVRVYAGGRVKHMTRAMNDVLARSFAEVRAGLGQRKSRVLTAAGPRDPGPARFPRWGEDPDLAFRVAAHGATFGGATLDHGSRLLLVGLADAAPDARRIVDLGCGNGVLGVAAALARPATRVIATDQSAAAVAATALTAEAAGVAERVEVHRADATEAVPDGWAELILLNPPFHTGAAVHAGVAHRLIRSCARALAPRGELRIVFNSHLGYRPLIERVIGPTRQVARDRTFTVLSAVRRSPGARTR
ncbi:methyltransferase [Leucobacter sp. CSA1]|uniref:Methyltransferase n=1 Tax=Leucobacter chromiisoli TaxID=2796471 RepID=A0A934Q647_9MICO|nr:methyltransferase [Leucobacter chromiisoli]